MPRKKRFKPKSEREEAVESTPSEPEHEVEHAAGERTAEPIERTAERGEGEIEKATAFDECDEGCEPWGGDEPSNRGWEVHPDDVDR